MRSIWKLVAATVLCASLSGCAASQEDITKALDGIKDGLTTTQKALEVTGEAYQHYCSVVPECKACKGEAAQQIQAALAVGTLTVGQIESIINSFAAK